MLRGLSNIMLVIGKNNTLCVCIDFMNHNNTTPKDEYPILMVDILVDSAI